MFKKLLFLLTITSLNFVRAEEEEEFYLIPREVVYSLDNARISSAEAVLKNAIQTYNFDKFETVFNKNQNIDNKIKSNLFRLVEKLSKDKEKKIIKIQDNLESSGLELFLQFGGLGTVITAIGGSLLYGSIAVLKLAANSSDHKMSLGSASLCLALSGSGITLGGLKLLQMILEANSKENIKDETDKNLFKKQKYQTQLNILNKCKILLGHKEQAIK